MASPKITITGTVQPNVDGGYILAELNQSVVLTDVATPTVLYKTVPVAYKALINTDGRLFAEGGVNPDTDPFQLYPSKGTLVTPSYGVYHKVNIVTTRRGNTARSFERWELDSSLSAVNVSSIVVIATLPADFYLHNQLAGRDQDDHPQYILADGSRGYVYIRDYLYMRDFADGHFVKYRLYNRNLDYVSESVNSPPF